MRLLTAKETKEWQALAESYCAGELAPAELATLEQRLRTDEAGRLVFLTFMEVHAGLAWEHRGAGLPIPSVAEVTAGEKIVAFPQGDTPRHTRSRTFAQWRWAIAALLIFAAFIVGLSRSWWEGASRPESPLVVSSQTAPAITSPATIRQSLHGRWADGRDVVAGAPVPLGAAGLQSGLIDVEAADGTHLLIEGPASWELVEAGHLRLLGGNVVVRMPKGDSGFVVEMPKMRVTDLGTEFGVSVMADGESRVQVFDGKVLAEGEPAAAPQELVAGDTLRSSVGGDLVAETFNEARYIRRFPAAQPHDVPGGALRSISSHSEIGIARASRPVTVDGELSEWNRAGAFRSTCLPPYAETYYVEGMMMYDDANLYVAAHVGDPEPMHNVGREGMEFAGGSVIVRLSSDRHLGWPLRGTAENVVQSRRAVTNPRKAAARPALLPDSVSDRITNMIFWHDARDQRARLKLAYGFDFHGDQTEPTGWRGAFRKDADGNGYTLEYAIPWELLHAAEDPPRAGDQTAALWMVHWSDAEGRICRGQLVDVANPDHGLRHVAPYVYFQNGPTWGKANFLAP